MEEVLDGSDEFVIQVLVFSGMVHAGCSIPSKQLQTLRGLTNLEKLYEHVHYMHDIDTCTYVHTNHNHYNSITFYKRFVSLIFNTDFISIHYHSPDSLGV